jgi:hypothetical protein
VVEETKGANLATSTTHARVLPRAGFPGVPLLPNYPSPAQAAKSAGVGRAWVQKGEPSFVARASTTTTRFPSAAGAMTYFEHNQKA